MNRAVQEPVAARRWASWPIAGLLAAAMLGVFLFAPEEQTMGPSQRIVYIHVSVAWFGLIGYLLAAASSFMYLLRRNIAWDDWAQAAAEVGWVCASLTLATGSLWAHEAWNTWWTWDPRLTTSLILWTIYAGYFVLRSSISDRNRRARVAAVLSIIGALDVPLVVMATRWFRGMHPVSPVMEPSMRVVLLLTAVALTIFFAYLVVFRRMQLALQREVHSLELATTRISSPAYS
jgi:heme exporter protein C